MEDLIRKSVEILGYALADCDISNHGKQLRIFIEKSNTTPEPGGGISVSDCEAVSRHLQRVFEVDGIDYDRLEVSSPGLDRKLKTSADFSRFSGFEADAPINVICPEETDIYARVACRFEVLSHFNGVVLVVSGDDDSPMILG